MPVNLAELLRLIAAAEGFGGDAEEAPRALDPDSEEDDAPLAPGMAS